MPASSLGPGKAGAHWVIVPIAEVTKLTDFFLARSKQLRLRADENPILGQRVFVDSVMLNEIRKEGIKIWDFEQCQGEGVYIPAGLPHQVSSLYLTWRLHRTQWC